MEVNLTELVWDDYIYPRKNKSNKTIDAYKEAMSIGAQFPPIEVQRVSNYTGKPKDYKGNEIGKDNLPAEPLLIIDGIHRWIAYHQYNTAEEKKAKEEERELRLITDIEVIEWKPGILNYVESKIELRLESSERNTRHGDRLSEGDKKATAQKIAEDDPEQRWTEQNIADKLRVKQQRVNEWISPIRKRQRAGRSAKIVKLARLGWTQEKVAELVGLSQNRISEIIGNTEFGEIDKMLSEGRTMDYIADHYQMDLALAWALRLEGKTDQERFGGSGDDAKELGWGIRIWDNWAFQNCDERFGSPCNGRIPAQLVAHTLFFFTNSGDLVMDPMAGGGVVPDVCLLFGRRCRAYDMVIDPLRPEIEEHYWNPQDMQWPDMKKKPDLIFFDPPYFKKKVKEYEERVEESVDEKPISSLSREEYLEFFRQFFRLAYDNTKDSTRLAFLNADWRDFQSVPAMEESPEGAITIFDYEHLISTAGWQVTHRIEAPMSTQRFSGGVVEAMQNKRILGIVGRTLLITRKRR